MSKMISLEKARKKYELKFVTAHLLENLYPSSGGPKKVMIHEGELKNFLLLRYTNHFLEDYITELEERYFALAFSKNHNNYVLAGQSQLPNEQQNRLIRMQGIDKDLAAAIEQVETLQEALLSTLNKITKSNNDDKWLNDTLKGLEDI